MREIKRVLEELADAMPAQPERRWKRQTICALRTARDECGVDVSEAAKAVDVWDVAQIVTALLAVVEALEE